MKLKAIAVVVMAVLWVLPQPAGASVAISNEMRITHTSAAPGLELYQYGTGTPKVSDFSTGIHASTVDASGSLELDLAGTFADWWDLDWEHRQCFDVTSADAESEYPLRFEVDTSGTSTNGADIRVIDDATGNLLDSYSEGPFPSTTSIVWAQAEPLPAGLSTYCVYFGNTTTPAVPTVSNEITVFTYTTGQSVEHYTLSDRYYGGNGANSRLTVVSYSADNVISDGTTTVTLGVGGTHTFSGLDEDSVITSTGPIDANYDRDGRETVIPEGYADSQFSFPTSRYVERFWVRSPHANTTVEAVSNGLVIASVNVGPADGSVVLNAPGVGNDPVSIRSTTGDDIIAMHIGTNRQDSMIGVPWFGDTLYGVASNNLNLGAFVPTTVSWIRSNGTVVPAQGIAIDNLTAIGGNGAFGSGRAIAVTGSSYFHAAQQADNDGTEVTSFLPQRLLGETFRTPISSRYIAVACPTVGTMLQFNGGAAVPCNGVGIGHYRTAFGFQAAGTLVEADHPIFVYYESSGGRNEMNILGPRGHIPYTTSVTIAADPVEEIPTLCGTWTSALLPAAGVFGQASAQFTAPTGTSVSPQISTDGSAFYGPDGTAATSFADGDIVPYVADFAATIQLRIELCTDDGTVTPSVDQFEIECDLIEPPVPLSNVLAITLPSPETGADEPLFRVYQQAAGSWMSSVRYVGGTNLANSKAIISTDHPSMQIEQGGGSIVDPSPAFSHTTAEPYTIRIEHKTITGLTSTLDFAVVDIDGVRDEVGVSLTLVG